MVARQLILDIQPKLIVDLFAGGGGMSVAFETAWGRSPDIAINHNDDALSMHRINHPQTRHFIADVFEVCPRGATQGRPVGWLHLSPDCFPAGTMVLTREGYRRIEELQVGDEVLTHKLRWRKVTATMSTIRPLLRVRGQGHPGLLVSPEHPFYVRQRRDVWQTEPRGYHRTLEPAEWKAASDLDKGQYWASPGEFPTAEVPSVPVYKSRTLAVSEDLLWLAGLYVADGWTRLTNTRAELVITCGKHEADKLRTALDRWPREGGRCASEELAWVERHTGTAYQFSTSHRGLVEWLREHFGHGAAEKTIPGWALGMGEALRRAFLDGYLSGDGCRPKADGSPLVICTTVSKALAFGLKALATSLGYAPAVYLRETQPDVIQGRKVNVLPAWSVRWRPARERAQSFFDGGMDWAPVREVSALGLEAEVFNISVEDDESYVVEGVVVHNCTHHSQAAGGQPRSKKIRGLAWVGYRWAGQVMPDVISLENVKQILQWGPLVAKRDKATGRVMKLDGTVADTGERVPVQDQYLIPNPKRAGQTWRHFVRSLQALGYVVEWRILCAADFGGHTTRERLFMIARRDGQPIVWPAPTHFKKPTKGQARWKPAADCIDWTIGCPSIFERSRPLAEATMRRIARGIVRYVLESGDPFIVNMAHGGKLEPIAEPMSTIATEKGGCRAIVAPTLVQAAHGEGSGPTKRRGSGARSIADPIGTVTASGGHALAAATLVQMGYGERDGQDPRALDIEAPLGTVVAGGIKHAVAAAHLVKFRGTSDGSPADSPVPTVTSGAGAARPAGAAHALGLSTAYLMQANGGFNETPGRDARAPMSTVTNTGSQQQLVTAHLAHLRRNCDGRDIAEPLRTVSAGGEHHGIVECHLAPEAAAGAERVAAFLMRYYGEGGQWSDPRDPMTTITTKDRMALVTVTIRGTPYVIVDIGLRMLEPRELFRAQDFPETYIIDRGHDGRRFSKSAQVRMCGNSVDPRMAIDFLRANAPAMAVRRVA